MKCLFKSFAHFLIGLLNIPSVFLCLRVRLDLPEDFSQCLFHSQLLVFPLYLVLQLPWPCPTSSCSSLAWLGEEHSLLFYRQELDLGDPAAHLMVGEV